MTCKDCTCYVDGHSKTGDKVAKGKGYCTMYNQDVSADGNCNSCMISGQKTQKDSRRTVPPAYIPDYSSTHTSNRPRTGMRAWAVVCFVFAAIYVMMAIIIETMILLGMTVFFALLGVMFIVLSASPQQIPYLFGKQSGMKKKTFVIICIAAAFCSFLLIASVTDNIEMETNTNSNTLSTSEAVQRRVTFIANFKTTEYELSMGESTDFTVELKPKDLTADSVSVEVSNTDVISISDVYFATEERKTILTFKATAIAEGEATLVVKSNTGDKTSNSVSFHVFTPPLVTSISKFSKSFVEQELGDTRTITVYMKPHDLTQEDFIIANSDDSIINIKNIALSSEKDMTVLTFDVIGVDVGTATIQIKGADGKTESNTLQITINEKDTSRRVYVTPYGEKYHYSAACAGKNARATTENSAIRSGLSRCKKCG